MFFSVNDLEPRELKKLELMFGKRLSAFHNPYYQICVEEVLAVLENEMDENELENFKKDSLFGIYVSEWAQELYEIIDYQLDEIYEKASKIVINKL